MSNPQPIQFLLHQLATNEQDILNFQKIYPIEIWKNDDKKVGIRIADLDVQNLEQYFDYLPKIYQEKIIRTCLSRVNGEAVLRVGNIK